MKKILLTTLIALFYSLGFSQGVTTASISGKVVDQNGEGLPGATVIARHEPSGTDYGTATRPDGRYNLPNVRIGGPYTIVATYIGYESQKVENVNLLLFEIRNQYK